MKSWQKASSDVQHLGKSCQYKQGSHIINKASNRMDSVDSDVLRSMGS